MSKEAHSNILATELKYYEANRANWLCEHKDEYALVSGEHVYGFFKEWVDGYRFGCHTVGVIKPFLLKKVLEYDEVYFVF